MARQKKINSLQVEEIKPEVHMTEEAVLEGLQTEIDQARVELENTRREIEEKKKELQANAGRDLTASEQSFVDNQVNMTNEKRSKQEIIEKQKAYDNIKVTGKFINRRAPGQPAKLAYIKYVDDPVKWYNFEDGKTYTIPRGFVDQINEHYHTPVFTQKSGDMDPNRPQSVIHEVDTSNKKYAFVPVSFG
jgi:hypothetical protein